MAKIHVHTKYSLLDAIIEPEELVKKCVEQGDTALCVTDHGNVYGNVEIYKYCKQYGIKYLYGCECYICDDVNVKNKDNKYYHLVVIAKNETGRINLNKLVSESTKYKYYGKPRIDFQMLCKYKEGLIVSSACMAGEIQRFIVNKEYQKLSKTVKKYKEEFGDDYYLEYQSHSDQTQQHLNKCVVELAKKLGIKYIVTTDAHYLNKQDQKYHNIFVQIGQAREVGETYNDCYLQSDEEILQICQSTSREDNLIALKNTEEIAEKCNVELPLSDPIMPDVEVPDGFHSEIEYLKSLCKKGWYNKKIDLKPNKQEYKDRLAYEINAIEKMGFEGYFLLVDSYCNSVKRRGIARGSAGGSLVCYLTNITDIDPIVYGLYFERFIDVGALELLEQGKITKGELKIPDVDSDFGRTDREKVLQFVIDKYGESRVVSLGSFQYIWAKGAIKDIGKVLNIPFDITNEMTSQFDKETIQEVLELGLLDKYKNTYPELFEYAEKLAGLPKSFSAHPCFPENTLVMTDNGYKKIQDINVGDLVFTKNNHFKSVAKTMVNVADNFTTIKCMGMFDITSTTNHPFFVKHNITQKRKREYSNPEWVEAKDIVVSDMLCLPINIENTIPSYKDLPTNEKDFWWIVGRYFGDGWCEYYELPRNEKRVIICCDKNTDKYLNLITDKIKNYFDYRYVEENTTYKIFIKNEQMFEYLLRFGKYASGKHLTGDILNLPVPLLKSFLEGYFSADGYIDKQGYYTFKTVSFELANGMIQCIAKVYHKHCGTHILKATQDVIDNRIVSSKEKYLVYFNPNTTVKDRCFYDEYNNCIWLRVKEVKNQINKDTNVYNLSVVDENTYTVNNIVVHNCGKVIAMDEVIKYNAIDTNEDGLVILQGDMYTAEDLGLIKADFLGLRTVDVIYDTLELIGKDYDYIAPHNLNFEDETVWKCFRSGFTSQIFQFESSGMQDTLKKINCNSINDLTVANALFRPGSIKYIDNYADRKKGLEEYEYLHPDLEPILKDTFGIIVFQEQLIEIGRIAKLSNPDELRKATAKKKAKLLEKVKPELYNGLANRGWTQEQLDALWETMLDFAKYSFNKSHSAAYAIIAYICMYLKVHHTKEFLCACIRSVSNKIEKVSECVEEAMRMGVPIYHGKYNNCSSITKIYNDGIMMGTNTIKFCNKEIANVLMNINYHGNSFIELLDKLKCNQDNNETEDDTNDAKQNNRQINILIGLDYFSDFGNNKKLQQIFQYYIGIKNKQQKVLLPSIRNVKQFKKDKIDYYSNEYGLSEYLIKKYSNKETAKQYSDIDNIGLLNELVNVLPDEKIDVIDYVKFQMEYLNYTTYYNPEFADCYYIVVAFKTYKDASKPIVTLRQLQTGKEIKTRIKKGSLFKKDPFGMFSILKIDSFKPEQKTKLIGGSWQLVDEYEDILEEFEVIKNLKTT